MKNQQHITAIAVFPGALWSQNTHTIFHGSLNQCAMQQNAGGSMAWSGMISPCVIKLWHSYPYSEYCHAERLLIRRCLLYTTQGTELECFVCAVRGRELETCFDYCMWTVGYSCRIVTILYLTLVDCIECTTPLPPPSVVQAKTQRPKLLLLRGRW